MCGRSSQVGRRPRRWNDFPVPTVALVRGARTCTCPHGQATGAGKHQGAGVGLRLSSQLCCFQASSFKLRFLMHQTCAGTPASQIVGGVRQ